MPNTIESLIRRINAEIVNPLIVLLFAIALVIFLWGVTRFIWRNDSEEERRIGARHMLWGIIGMFIMIAVWAIIWVIINTFGIDPNVLG